MKPIQLLSEGTWLELSPKRTYDIYFSLHMVYTEVLKQIEDKEEVENA